MVALSYEVENAVRAADAMNADEAVAHVMKYDSYPGAKPVGAPVALDLLVAWRKMNEASVIFAARAKAIGRNPALLGAVPVKSRDRHIPRKEQAALARELFKQLGLKGVSVRAPRYSMAHSVDVSIPRPAPDAHDLACWPHHHDAECCGSPGGHDEAKRCPACKSSDEVRQAVKLILARAFPCHDDRSDSQSDYFDFCWSID